MGVNDLSLAGYEVFLPAIAAAIHGKKKEDLEVSKRKKVLEMSRRTVVAQLTDDELKMVVAVIFRDSLARFMRDSHLYRIDVPVDIYEDVSRYDISCPEGFIIERVISFLDGKVRVPKRISSDISSIFLGCKPLRDVSKAFYATIAISIRRIGDSAPCVVNAEFLERYYDAILFMMFHRLYSMQEREWHSIVLSNDFKREYVVELNRSKREGFLGGNPVRFTTKRLTDNVRMSKCSSM